MLSVCWVSAGLRGAGHTKSYYTLAASTLYIKVIQGVLFFFKKKIMMLSSRGGAHILCAF